MSAESCKRVEIALKIGTDHVHDHVKVNTEIRSSSKLQFAEALLQSIKLADDVFIVAGLELRLIEIISTSKIAL